MNNYSNSKKKILLIGNSSLVIFGFRKELIQRLVECGHEVWTSFPNGPFGEGEEISKEFGCNFVEVDINRRGKNPFEDMKLINSYYRLFKKVKPDVVLAYTAKCDIYGGILCRMLNIPFIPNITGLGKGLVDGGVTTLITKNLYKLAVKKAHYIFFQNTQDKLFFDKNNIKYKSNCILPGSGININEFIALPYPDDNKIIFTYMARVMKAKGIEQFLEAAEYIKQKYHNTEFHICGYCEEDYLEIIKDKQEKGIIVYHGLVKDVKFYQQNSHCIVLPSFHPEGISNVLLEGAAAARPLITTNRVGCREVVDDEVTGFLIKERDSKDLIAKIESFIQLSNEEKKQMGIKGREKVAIQFNRDIVVNAYIDAINKVGV